MGDFCNCTSLTNTPVVCYLYSIDRIPADGTLWSTTVQGCWGCQCLSLIHIYLRVLNSQPPALTKHTKGDLHSIEQISERMLSTPTESSVEFMVAELDDALQSLMFRWNICYERYSSFHLSDNEKKKIGSIIQSGIDFLQKKKEVPL